MGDLISRLHVLVHVQHTCRRTNKEKKCDIVFSFNNFVRIFYSHSLEISSQGYYKANFVPILFKH